MTTIPPDMGTIPNIPVMGCILPDQGIPDCGDWAIYLGSPYMGYMPIGTYMVAIDILSVQGIPYLG
jgi:hypothetical protein